MLHASVYVRGLKSLFLETKRRMVVARAWDEGEGESCCSMGRKLQSYKMGEF